MATIKCFEDIESRKIAGEICMYIGRLIDEGRFKKNYPLFIRWQLAALKKKYQQS